MDRGRLSAIAHQDHPIAAPLDDASVDRLLDRALPRGDERVLDLGCGPGAWLVKALERRPGVRAVGVDIEPEAIAQTTAAVAGLGPAAADRVRLVTADATSFRPDEPFDLVLAVGAAHAFGGLLPTLEAARSHLAPGGSVLVGDGFWERPPGAPTLAVGFAAEEFAPLAETVDRVVAAGWVPLHGHVSTRQEWDHYEWSWTGSVARWALDHADGPDAADAADALEAAGRHRREWLHGYRGTLGFLTMLLRPTSARGQASTGTS